MLPLTPIHPTDFSGQHYKLEDLLLHMHPTRIFQNMLFASYNFQSLNFSSM